MYRILSAALLFVSSFCATTNADDVAELIAQIKGEDPQKSGRAAQSLAPLGRSAVPAIPALVEALSDTRPADNIPLGVPAPQRDVASFASEALAAIGEPAVPSLVRELNTPDASVRERVIETLKQIGKPASSALPHLKEYARNGETEEQRYLAIESYAAISSDKKTCIATLTDALTDKSPQVRGLAARMLGDYESEASSAVPALIKALGDTEFRWHSITPDFTGQRAVRYDAAEALGKIGPSSKVAADKLTDLMGNDLDPEVRVSASLALFCIDNNRADAMQSLIRELKNDRVGMAGPQEAARSLATLGVKAAPAFDALCQSLQHEKPFVRISAVRAIKEIGREKAVTALLPALDDKDPQVRNAAATALGELGTISAPAIPRLIELLNDRQELLCFIVQRAAAEALGKIGPPAKAAVPHLSRLAESDADTELRKVATEAVRRISRVE